MKLKFMYVLFCVFIFSTLASTTSAEYKDNNYRSSVDFIDDGEVKDGAYVFHNYTLICVDGVKVLTTTTKSGGINSIIIPGPCKGIKVIEEIPKQAPENKVTSEGCMKPHEEHKTKQKVKTNISW